MAKCDATKWVTAKYLQRICHYFCTLSTISYGIHLTSSGWSCWRHLCTAAADDSMASVRVHLLWVSHGSRMQCKCINHNNNNNYYYYYSSRRRRRQKSCHHFWFRLIEMSMSGKSTPSRFNRVLVTPCCCCCLVIAATRA